MPLYEVAILEEPTKKEERDGVLEKLMFGPTPIIAKNFESAGAVAVMEMGSGVKINKNKMRIIVRPFA